MHICRPLLVQLHDRDELATGHVDNPNAGVSPRWHSEQPPNVMHRVPSPVQDGRCLDTRDVLLLPQNNIVPTLRHSMKRRWSLPGVSLGIACMRSAGVSDTRLRPGWEMAMLYLLAELGARPVRAERRGPGPDASGPGSHCHRRACAAAAELSGPARRSRGAHWPG